jgi:hypothetical protein
LFFSLNYSLEFFIVNNSRLSVINNNNNDNDSNSDNNNNSNTNNNKYNHSNNDSNNENNDNNKNNIDDVEFKEDKIKNLKNIEIKIHIKDIIEFLQNATSVEIGSFVFQNLAKHLLKNKQIEFSNSTKNELVLIENKNENSSNYSGLFLNWIFFFFSNEIELLSINNKIKKINIEKNCVVVDNNSEQTNNNSNNNNNNNNENNTFENVDQIIIQTTKKKLDKNNIVDNIVENENHKIENNNDKENEKYDDATSIIYELRKWLKTFKSMIENDSTNKID